MHKCLSGLTCVLQLYLPLVNIFLWVTMSVTVIAAGSSHALVDAAGVAVALVMVMDRWGSPLHPSLCRYP